MVDAKFQTPSVDVLCDSPHVCSKEVLLNTTTMMLLRGNLFLFCFQWEHSRRRSRFLISTRDLQTYFTSDIPLVTNGTSYFPHMYHEYHVPKLFLLHIQSLCTYAYIIEASFIK